MGSHLLAAIDDLSNTLEREDFLVRLGDLGQVGGRSLQRVCQWTLTATFDAMTRHAGVFEFNDPEMIVVSTAAKPKLRLQRQKDGCEDPTDCSVPSGQDRAANQGTRPVT